MCRGQESSRTSGHPTVYSISVWGVVTPSTVTVPRMNLGKTITLPCSWESLNVGSRSCANAGGASARAGVSSNKKPAHFIVQCMVLPPISALEGPCSIRKRHAMSEPESVNGNFNGLARRPRDLVRSAGLRPAGWVRFSGLVQRLDVGPDVELPHLLEQRRARHTKQLRGLLDAA